MSPAARVLPIARCRLMSLYVSPKLYGYGYLRDYRVDLSPSDYGRTSIIDHWTSFPDSRNRIAQPDIQTATSEPAMKKPRVAPTTEHVPTPFRLANSHMRLAWAKTWMYQVPQEVLEKVFQHTAPPASVKQNMGAVLAEINQLVYMGSWKLSRWWPFFPSLAKKNSRAIASLAKNGWPEYDCHGRPHHYRGTTNYWCNWPYVLLARK